MPSCPKCRHHWNARRAPKSSVPMHESAPGTIFPQRCWECGRTMKPGETAHAAPNFPASVCGNCYGRPYEDGRGNRAQTVEVLIVPDPSATEEQRDAGFVETFRRAVAGVA